jgi:dTDP-4-dehydrorhamnose 3,5-epimerase
MLILDTELRGAAIIELEERRDDRGLFARAFCAEEFAAHGLEPHVAQANLSYNRRAGTIRGLHWQAYPAVETKYFRCTRGATYHVVVDTRAGSPTYLEHIGVELSAESRRGLVVPAECATGYQALEDHSEVLYLVSGTYSPEHERGLRFDDPQLGLTWPLTPSGISDKDRSWSLLTSTKESS